MCFSADRGGDGGSGGWGESIARGCGGGGFVVISEQVPENSRLVRAGVFQKGFSSSLAECPYRLHRFKNTQTIIQSLSRVVMLFELLGRSDMEIKVSGE